jgi:hypothetical protein
MTINPVAERVPAAMHWQEEKEPHNFQMNLNVWLSETLSKSGSLSGSGSKWYGIRARKLDVYRP